ARAAPARQADVHRRGNATTRGARSGGDSPRDRGGGKGDQDLADDVERGQLGTPGAKKRQRVDREGREGREAAEQPDDDEQAQAVAGREPARGGKARHRPGGGRAEDVDDEDADG